MNLTVEKFWQAEHHMVETFIDRLPALAVGIVVFILFYGISRLLDRIIRKSVPRQRRNLGTVFARLTAGATVLLGFLVAFSIVAPSFQAGDLIKVLGIGGVAIGFAFQNILQNFVAGLLLLWAEPFRVGDEIKLDAFEGTVEEIQARATIIKTYDERRVVIPNADLFTRSVIVNTALDRRRWEYDITANADVNLGSLKSTIAAAVSAVPEVLSDPAPEVFVMDLNGSNPSMVKLRVLWWSHDARQHQMMGSYDQVLTSIVHALERAESERPKAGLSEMATKQERAA